jgi:hypothetical protein
MAGSTAVLNLHVCRNSLLFVAGFIEAIKIDSGFAKGIKSFLNEGDLELN